MSTRVVAFISVLLLVLYAPPPTHTHTQDMEVPSYRVLVLGESGVGKSSLVQRYVFDQFSEQGPPPSGREEERKTVIFKNGRHVELRICDTQGTYSYS